MGYLTSDTKSIAQMTAEIRGVNVEKGWREPGKNTFGDYIALLHSEVSEALEAYRIWKLMDGTAGSDITPGGNPGAKPQGVGSEMADVFIRLLDMCDVYRIDLEAEYERKLAYNRTRPYQHGGKVL